MLVVLICLCIPLKGNLMLTDKEMMEYMLKQLGGKQKVKQALIKQRLMDAVTGGTTIGQLIEVAKDEDWLPTLLALPIASLVGGNKQATASSPSGRITIEQKEQMVGDIKTYLGERNRAGKAQIAKAIGVDPKKLVIRLRAMVEDGTIVTHGDRSKTVYSLGN